MRGAPCRVLSMCQSASSTLRNGAGTGPRGLQISVSTTQNQQDSFSKPVGSGCLAYTCEALFKSAVSQRDLPPCRPREATRAHWHIETRRVASEAVLAGAPVGRG